MISAVSAFASWSCFSFASSFANAARLPKSTLMKFKKSGSRITLLVYHFFWSDYEKNYLLTLHFASRSCSELHGYVWLPQVHHQLIVASFYRFSVKFRDLESKDIKRQCVRPRNYSYLTTWSICSRGSCKVICLLYNWRNIMRILLCFKIN